MVYLILTQVAIWILAEDRGFEVGVVRVRRSVPIRYVKPEVDPRFPIVMDQDLQSIRKPYPSVSLVAF